MTNAAGKELSDYLNTVIKSPRNAELNLSGLPDELKDFGSELVSFCENVMQAQLFAEALSEGRLDAPPPPRENLLAGPLKSLHASLKHLTWQTQQVAAGDYQQQVDFMGDFSAAFNTMTEQLARQRTALLRELDSWRVENHALRQNTTLYELLMRQIARSIIVADILTGDWMYVSEEIRAVISGADNVRQLNRWIAEQLRTGGPATRTTKLELHMTDGSRYFLVSIHPMRWLSREAAAFVFTDISGERRELESLQSMAHYDALTGLQNRYRGMQMLEQWIGEKRKFCLCFVDIDDLKFINDYFSHRAGDQYLLRVADGLREGFENAFVFRIGGDEFLLLVECDEKKAKEQFELLRRRIDILGRRIDPRYRYSFSYGIVAVEPENESTASALLDLADARMYAYKRAFKRKDCDVLARSDPF